MERSGDHITNIAEEIVFFIDAKVLKHSGQTDEHYLMIRNKQNFRIISVFHGK